VWPQGSTQISYQTAAVCALDLNLRAMEGLAMLPSCSAPSLNTQVSGAVGADSVLRGII
jgi:hypothetical protein